jgi:predicted naringenin-chalcone synthase
LGKYGTAVTDPDTYAHAYSDSNDLADSLRVALTDSDVQRDTVSHVTTADSSHVCVPDTDAERVTRLELFHKSR